MTGIISIIFIDKEMKASEGQVTYLNTQLSNGRPGIKKPAYSFRVSKNWEMIIKLLLLF